MFSKIDACTKSYPKTCNTVIAVAGLATVVLVALGVLTLLHNKGIINKSLFKVNNGISYGMIVGGSTGFGAVVVFAVRSCRKKPDVWQWKEVKKTDITNDNTPLSPNGQGGNTGAADSKTKSTSYSLAPQLRQEDDEES